MVDRKLPAGWKWENLDGVTLEYISGGTPSTKITTYWQGSIPWTRSANLTANYLKFGEKFISREAVAETATNVVPKNNVLVTTRVGVGKAAVNLIDIAISQDLTGLVLDVNRILPIYLVYYLHSPKVQRLFEQYSRGTTIQGIQRSDLSRIKIPLPPLDTQRKIVAILEKAEATQRLRAEADALTQDFLQSVFLEMFGDPIRNENGWEVVKLDEICDDITVGIVVRPASYYCENGIPAFRSLNIKPNGLATDNLVYVNAADNDTKLAKSKIKSGDVLVVRTGYPGTASVVPDAYDGANCIDLIIVRPNHSQVNSQYLSFFINSPYGKAQCLASNTGLAQQHLNIQKIKEMAILLPPLPYQKRFAELVEKTDKLILKQVKSNEYLESLTNGLLSKAFAGDLIA